MRGFILFTLTMVVVTTSVIMYEPQASERYAYEKTTQPVEVPYLDLTVNQVKEQQHGKVNRTESDVINGDHEEIVSNGGEGGQDPDHSNGEGYAEYRQDSGGMETGENEAVSELVEPDMDAYSPDSDGSLTYVGNWTISFYCPCEICCGVWATGCTASGVLATEWHTVATDQFEFGTELYVEGLGYFVVEDRGVEGAWLDVFVNDHQEALNLGMQTRDVYIVN